MAPACRPVLVAPDSFKGSFSAREVAEAIGRGLSTAGIREIDLAPLADGGEGTAELLLERLGGEERRAATHDPLGRERESSFALLADGQTAVVEVAQGSGLVLLDVAERDAEAASSVGTGELIVAALNAGAVEILVAAGGSATTDGGSGAIAAVRDAGGLRGTRLTVLCDVRTPFELAAVRFGPQKGADADAVARLTARLEDLAARLPRDPRGVAMSGAAGGLAGGLWAAFDARLIAGAPYVLGALDIEHTLRARLADLVRAGSDVVLDFSFWSRGMREEYRELLRPLGVVPETVYLATDRATALHRVSARAARDGDDFKVSMELAAFYFDHFEAPTAAEGPLTVISNVVQ